MSLLATVTSQSSFKMATNTRKIIIIDDLMMVSVSASNLKSFNDGILQMHSSQVRSSQVGV